MKGLCSFVLCIVLLAGSPLHAQRLARVFEYVDAADYYVNRLPTFFSSFQTCLARGYSYEVCQSAFTYCAFNAIPAGGIAGSYINIFQLNDVFRANCGSPGDQCFACCYVPARAGCHSSFFPGMFGQLPINCDSNYGQGTSVVGPTLVDNPIPGQACLFTPQTCEHIALCNGGLSPEEIESINDDPDHLMKSPRAVQSRAQYLGTTMMANWSKMLNGHHTSADAPSDSLRQDLRPLGTLGSFITGRGCTGWLDGLPDTLFTDWSEPQFRINDAQGAYAGEASHWNGIRQLGVVRLMASVPNLYNRFAYVESRIWTPDAIRDYLAGVADPDAALLRHMSPIALELLEESTQLQDYRLLAVPLPGEQVPVRLYNGCQLAEPPALQARYEKRGARGIDVSLEAADAQSLLVLWGDGTITSLAAGTRNASHDYATGGRYQVIAMAQNDAGLRTAATLPVQTSATGAGSASGIVPVFSEIQLVDLRAGMVAFAGNAATMLFELEAWPAGSDGFALGISRAVSVPLETTGRFGTVAGWNMQGVPLQSISLRPSRYGDGIQINFQRSYFTLDRLRAGVYSTAENRLRFHELAVTPEMVRLYPAGSSTPVLLTQPRYGADGRLQIPIEAGGVRYARIDLLFPQSFLAQAIQGPAQNAGVTATLSEVKPDVPETSRKRPSRH